MIWQVPHYYKKFNCIASECRDNCCMGGWEIDIDDDTADYYLNLEGEFGDRLRKNIGHTDEYCFKLKNGSCPFLDNKGLCEIYQVLGEDKMGVVCSQFPRFTEYFGSIKETGIGLACEEAARLILSDDEKFCISSSQIEEEVFDDPEFDEKYYNILFKIRNNLFKLFELKDISLCEKLIIFIRFCDELQFYENSNDYEKLSCFSQLDKEKIKEKYLTRFTNNEENNKSFISQDLQSNIEKIMYSYDDLEVLNDKWKNYLDDCFYILHNEEKDDCDQYILNQKKLSEKLSESEKEFINICKYFIFRYFMEAVYDHDILGKARLIACNILIIREMCLLEHLNNSFNEEKLMEIIHVFSRQVEYSRENIENLYESYLFDDVYSTETLCQIFECLML